MITLDTLVWDDNPKEMFIDIDEDWKPNYLHHVYIVGSTGAGKSTLLFNIARDLIERGEGVGIIDPHGGWSWDLMHFIPKWRTKDVICVDPSDTEYPIGFNITPFSPSNPQELDHIVDAFRLFGTSKTIRRSGFSSIRLSFIRIILRQRYWTYQEHLRIKSFGMR